MSGATSASRSLASHSLGDIIVRRRAADTDEPRDERLPRQRPASPPLNRTAISKVKRKMRPTTRCIWSRDEQIGEVNAHHCAMSNETCNPIKAPSTSASAPAPSSSSASSTSATTPPRSGCHAMKREYWSYKLGKSSNLNNSDCSGSDEVDLAQSACSTLDEDSSPALPSQSGNSFSAKPPTSTIIGRNSSHMHPIMNMNCHSHEQKSDDYRHDESSEQNSKTVTAITSATQFTPLPRARRPSKRTLVASPSCSSPDQSARENDAHCVARLRETNAHNYAVEQSERKNEMSSTLPANPLTGSSSATEATSKLHVDDLPNNQSHSETLINATNELKTFSSVSAVTAARDRSAAESNSRKSCNTQSTADRTSPVTPHPSQCVSTTNFHSIEANSPISSHCKSNMLTKTIGNNSDASGNLLATTACHVTSSRGSTTKLVSQVSPIPMERCTSVVKPINKETTPLQNNGKQAISRWNSGSTANAGSAVAGSNASANRANIRIVNVQLKDRSPSHLSYRPTNQISTSNTKYNKGQFGLSTHRIHSKSMENLINLYEHLTSNNCKNHQPFSGNNNTSRIAPVKSVARSSPLVDTINQINIQSEEGDRKMLDKSTKTNFSHELIVDDLKDKCLSECGPTDELKDKHSTFDCWSEFLAQIPPPRPAHSEGTGSGQSEEDEPEIEAEQDLQISTNWCNNETLIAQVEGIKSISFAKNDPTSFRRSMSDVVPLNLHHSLPTSGDNSSADISLVEPASDCKSNSKQLNSSISMVEYDSIFKSKYESLRERYARERRLWTERNERERAHGAQVDDILRQLQETLLKSKQQLSDMKVKLDNSPNSKSHASMLAAGPRSLLRLNSVTSMNNNHQQKPPIDACWLEIARLCSEMKKMIDNNNDEEIDISKLHKSILELEQLCDKRVCRPKSKGSEECVEKQITALQTAMIAEENEAEGIRKRLTLSRCESHRLASEMKDRIARVSSVDEAKQLSAIQAQLEAARREVRILNCKLREAHANYDTLELAHQRLIHEMSVIKERHELEDKLMRQRIDDLTGKLYKSEKSLVAAKCKLGKYEISRKNFSSTSNLSLKEGIEMHEPGSVNIKSRSRARTGHSLDRDEARPRASTSHKATINLKSKLKELEAKIDTLHSLLSICVPSNILDNVPIMAIEGIHVSPSGQHTPEGSVTSDLGSSSSVATTNSAGGSLGAGLNTCANVDESAFPQQSQILSPETDAIKCDQVARMWRRVENLNGKIKYMERAALDVMSNRTDGSKVVSGSLC